MSTRVVRIPTRKAAPEPPPAPLPTPNSPLGMPPAPPHGAICTPVLPARIRIPFPAIDFDCGRTRYRTSPMELVAEPIECGVGNAECGMAEAPSTPNPPHSQLPIPPSAFRTPHSLRRGFGVWHLVFDGREALLRPERGLLYVAWLLHHPPAQPLHALDLAAKIPDLYRAQLGLSALTDPATGQTVTLPSHARLQERSLALDDAQVRIRTLVAAFGAGWRELTEAQRVTWRALASQLPGQLGGSHVYSRVNIVRVNCGLPALAWAPPPPTFGILICTGLVADERPRLTLTQVTAAVAPDAFIVEASPPLSAGIQFAGRGFRQLTVEAIVAPANG